MQLNDAMPDDTTASVIIHTAWSCNHQSIAAPFIALMFGCSGTYIGIYNLYRCKFDYLQSGMRKWGAYTNLDFSAKMWNEVGILRKSLDLSQICTSGSLEFPQFVLQDLVGFFQFRQLFLESVLLLLQHFHLFLLQLISGTGSTDHRVSILDRNERVWRQEELCFWKSGKMAWTSAGHLRELNDWGRRRRPFRVDGEIRQRVYSENKSFKTVCWTNVP